MCGVSSHHLTYYYISEVFMRKVFNDLQLQFMKDNYNKMTYKEMSELELFNGLDSKQIRTKACTMGLKKNRQFNKRLFENIDNPDKAYWIGFIYADGYITKAGELGIELQYSDSGHLEKLNTLIGGVHKITRRKREQKFNGYEYTSDLASFRVFSVDIVKDLHNNGIDFNKTKSSVYPKVDDDLFFDFVRGFLGGDGCIYVNDKNKITVSFTNSNSEFLEYLSEKIYNLIGIKGSIYKEKEYKYRLQYFKQSEIDTLLDKLYKDEVCCKLERKYNKYKSVI